VLNRQIYLPRGKTLGGSSSTNAMAYVRGNAADYDEWAALGATGWSHSEILKYFKKSEHNEQITNDLHGKNGPLHVSYATRYATPLRDAFIDACVEKGHPHNDDINGASQTGVGRFQFTIKDGVRWSTATAFLKPVMARPNLTVITNAHTKQILIENDKAIGIEYFTGKTTTQKAYASREVILSAGAFASPQLLMVSGVGDPNELGKHGIALKKELVGVGKNLQDHLFSAVSCLSTEQVGVNHALKPLNQLGALMQYLLTKKGVLTISPLEAVAFLKITDSPDPVDFQFHFAPMHLGEEPGKVDPYDLDTYSREDGYIILPTLLKPKSSGYVGLNSADSRDMPLIDPRFLSDEADALTLLKGAKKAMEVMEAKAFEPWQKRLITPPNPLSDDEIDLFNRQILETVYHPVGTCKMGTDEAAVVNPQLQVRGIENLRVIDASVMPRIVSGNTNAATIMIGEKGAAMILGED
jgi:choline dehydrogenase